MGPNVKTMGRPAVAGLGSGVVDSNRFYSMLLDARTANASVSESMHDVAERLVKGEKDNAKLALDHLWKLKKSLTGDGTDETVELLIAYYQEKINVLREREEAIRKVSKETRALVEERKQKEEELSIVKTQIGISTQDLQELNTKLAGLKRREAELTVAERQLKIEIAANEGQIIEGLQEIIMSRPEEAEDERKDDTKAFELIRQAAVEIGKSKAEPAAEAAEPLSFNEPFAFSEPAPAPVRPAPISIDNYGEIEIMENKTPPAAPAPIKAFAPDILNSDDSGSDEATVSLRIPSAPAQAVVHEPIVYPKSVVRMGGKIIGEYYHDGNIVTKEERHYIYNSRFMAERLSAGLGVLKHRFGQELHAELVKITEDAANRVRDNRRFHFEVSTNEILNDKNLKQLSADLRRRVWDDAERFAVRLSAKIEALGSNYEAMLQEQMERCAENG